MAARLLAIAWFTMDTNTVLLFHPLLGQSQAYQPQEPSFRAKPMVWILGTILSMIFDFSQKTYLRDRAGLSLMHENGTCNPTTLSIEAIFHSNIVV